MKDLPKNPGRPRFPSLFLPLAPTTEGGVSAPPFSSLPRSRAICRKAAHESDYTWDMSCGWCGKRIVGELAHEIGDSFWHLRCVDREICRREVELGERV